MTWRGFWTAIGGPYALSVWSWVLTAPLSLVGAATVGPGRLLPSISEGWLTPTWWGPVIAVTLLLGGAMLLAHATVLSPRRRPPRPLIAIAVFAVLGVLRALMLQWVDETWWGFGTPLESRLILSVTLSVILLSAIAFAVDHFRTYTQALSRLKQATAELEESRRQAERSEAEIQRELLDAVARDIDAMVCRRPSGSGDDSNPDVVAAVRSASHELAEDLPQPTATQGATSIGWHRSLLSIWGHMQMPPPLASALLIQVAGSLSVAPVFGVVSAALNFVIGFLVVLALLTLVRRLWPRLPRAMLNGWGTIGLLAGIGVVAAWVTGFVALWLGFDCRVLPWQAVVIFSLIGGAISLGQSTLLRHGEIEDAWEAAVSVAARQAEAAYVRFNSSRRYVADLLHGSIQGELLRAQTEGIDAREAWDQARTRLVESRARQECQRVDESLQVLLDAWASALDVTSRVSDEALGILRRQTRSDSRLHDALSEALANAVRHAESPRVEVEIDVVDGHLQLTVVTEGPDANPENPGIGLMSMRKANTFVELSSTDRQTELIVRI